MELFLATGHRELTDLARVHGASVQGFEVRGRQIPASAAALSVPSWHLPEVHDGRVTAALSTRIFEQLGCRRMILHPQRGPGAWLRTRASLQTLLEHSPPEVAFCVENMVKPDYPSARVLADVVRGLREVWGERVGVCLDTSHVSGPDQLPVLVDHVEETLGHAHLSDLRPRKRGFRRHSFPGEGAYDWAAVLTSIAQHYRGPMTVEPHEERDKRWDERLRASLTLLRECWPSE